MLDVVCSIFKKILEDSKVVFYVNSLHSHGDFLVVRIIKEVQYLGSFSFGKYFISIYYRLHQILNLELPNAFDMLFGNLYWGDKEFKFYDA